MGNEVCINEDKKRTGFFEICNSIVNDKNYNGYFDRSKLKTGVREGKGFNYEGCIYWYHVSFSYGVINYLNNKYIDISGFNIMPYTIMKDTVKKAKKKHSNKNNNYGFKDKVNEDSNYVDFDGISGNFHRKPDYLNAQIVLTVGTLGPGWFGGKSITEKELRDNNLTKIKVNFYFPQISDKAPEVKEKEAIEKLDEKAKTNYMEKLIKKLIDEMLNKLNINEEVLKGQK